MHHGPLADCQPAQVGAGITLIASAAAPARNVFILLR
jgi:hypothetical protein